MSVLTPRDTVKMPEVPLTLHLLCARQGANNCICYHLLNTYYYLFAQYVAQSHSIFSPTCEMDNETESQKGLVLAQDHLASVRQRYDPIPFCLRMGRAWRGDGCSGVPTQHCGMFSNIPMAVLQKLVNFHLRHWVRMDFALS